MSLTRSLLRLRQYSVASTAETVVPEAAILAVLREGSGERSAARERKSGRVPSVVLQRQSGKNGGKNRLISVQESQIRKFVAEYGQSSFLSRLFRLHIRSEFRQEADLIADVRVLPRMAHFNPEKETPINISFIDAPSDAWLKVHIPLVYKGKDVSPGLKKGRPLKTVKKTAEFMCPADLIPPFIEVDLSELDAGQQILVGDLNVPLELSRLLPKEDVVCEIMGSALSILRKNSERLGFNSETMLLIA